MRVAISNQYSLPFHTNVRRVIYNAHNDTKNIQDVVNLSVTMVMRYVKFTSQNFNK